MPWMAQVLPEVNLRKEQRVMKVHCTAVVYRASISIERDVNMLMHV
jgi:hypothetical protein